MGVVIELEPSLASWRSMFCGTPAGETLPETTPRMNANTAKLPVQAIRLPAWLRSACAVGEDSRAR